MFSTPKEFEEAYKVNYLTPQESLSLIAASVSKLVDELRIYNKYMAERNKIAVSMCDSLDDISGAIDEHNVCY